MINTPGINLVISKEAHQRFKELVNKLESNQHETASEVFETMDINKITADHFARLAEEKR